jgi:hypothetical protein
MNWPGEVAFHSTAWTVVREVSASPTQVTVPDTSYRPRPQIRTICKAIHSNKVSLGRFVAWFVAKTGPRCSCYLSPRGRGRIALDAIRVRGYSLSIGRAPSPKPTRGESARCRRCKFRISFSKSQFQINVHDLATQSARVMHLSLALEGVGNAGCPLHPRPRVRFVVIRSTRVTTSTPESPGIPARNGFNGLCRALPGDRAVLPPSSAD